MASVVTNFTIEHDCVQLTRRPVRLEGAMTIGKVVKAIRDFGIQMPYDKPVSIIGRDDNGKAVYFRFKVGNKLTPRENFKL